MLGKIIQFFMYLLILICIEWRSLASSTILVVLELEIRMSVSQMLKWVSQRYPDWVALIR